MFNIADYYQRVMINQHWPLDEECCVYSMDGHPDLRGGEYDMAKHVGLPSCHCCDYFIFEKESISLIEIKDIVRIKEDVERQFSHRSEKKRNKYFLEKVAQKSTLKMYGSMVVLCWVAHKCKIMANNLKKQYNFWLVVPCATKDIKAFKSVETRLKSDLRAVASKHSLIEVVVLSPEKLEEKIRENAVSV